MSHRFRAASILFCLFIPAVSATSLAGDRFGDDPFADEVIDFDPGSGGAKGFDNPLTTLGSPERFTGEGVFPVVVSPFSPAFGINELLSIGKGGFLTVRFDTPVTNDAANPHGIDLLLFGNTGFIDSNFPEGVVGGLFGNDGGTIEVSADGISWHTVEGVGADGLFPTMGYLDAGPYDEAPGTIPTDFTRPVDPSLTFDDFIGLDHNAIRELYRGSGGGAGIDIGALDLDAISFVRISNFGTESVEIEALADVAAVPAPGLAPLLAIAIVHRRRRAR